MIRRTRNTPATDGQLPLPFVAQAPKQQSIAPITVRIPDAVRMTGIGRSKMYELIASGDIETVKIGRCTLIPVASLYALVDRGRSSRL